jgi:chromate reductase, NAD(P)H dehydrogenase (quinone)
VRAGDLGLSDARICKRWLRHERRRTLRARRLEVKQEGPKQPLTILGIAGSLRRGSYNRGLIRAAIELAPAGTRLRSHDLGDLPLYNADVEARGDPHPVARLKRAIAAADALLIATPEYNHCVPGVLKNAIDWASRPKESAALLNKPVAAVAASTGMFGAAFAQADLRKILKRAGARVLETDFAVPRCQMIFDEEGRLTDDGVRTQLAEVGYELLEELVPVPVAAAA